MSARETDARGPTTPFPVARCPDDPDTGSSGDVLRLVLTPAIVAVLFAGGVYWVKLQLAPSRTGPDEAATVRVSLLRSDPASIATPQTPQPPAATVAAPTAVAFDRPGRPAETVTTTLAMPEPPRSEAFTPAERPAPSVVPDPAPDLAVVRFRRALIDHVARYQRFPRAARAARLSGSVGTVFSMRRDGTVLGVWVTSSSGQKLFDKEAVDTIWRAQPMPAIPPGLPDTLTVQTTLVFEPG